MAERFLNSLAQEQRYSDSIEKDIAALRAQRRKKSAAIAKKEETVKHHYKLLKHLLDERSKIDERLKELHKEAAMADSFETMSLDD